MSAVNNYTYPVGFPVPPAAYYFTSQKDREKNQKQETQQGCLSLKNGQLTAVTKSGHYTTVLEKSFAVWQDKLQTSLIRLSEQNRQLHLALIDQTSRSKKAALLCDTEATILETRALFLQQQMQQLIQTHAENTKRLENLLTAQQQGQQVALDLAKQTWQQEKTELTRRRQALQTQQNALIGQRDALLNRSSTLQKQINEEPIRQQAAMQKKVAAVKKYFIGVLEEEKATASDPEKLKRWGGGRAADGKGALIFLKKHLENSFGSWG